MLWGLFWHNFGVSRGPGWLRIAESRFLLFILPWMFALAATFGASSSRRLWVDTEMQLFFGAGWLVLLGLTAVFAVRGVDVVAGVRAASVWTGPGLPLWSSVLDLEDLQEVRLIWILKPAPPLGLVIGQRHHRQVLVQLVGAGGRILWASSEAPGGVVRHDGSVSPLGGSDAVRAAAAELAEALGAPLVERTVRR